MISKIYESNQILFRSGTRKGKTKYHIALAIQKRKMKQFQDKEFIAFLEKKVKEYDDRWKKKGKKNAKSKSKRKKNATKSKKPGTKKG
tara:strand:- start:1025 stop:1288 length:264 start_codon:yes stop_codon:yes gene_type:complete